MTAGDPVLGPKQRAAVPVNYLWLSGTSATAVAKSPSWLMLISHN